MRIYLGQRQQALLPQRLERAHEALIPSVPDVVAVAEKGERMRRGWFVQGGSSNTCGGAPPLKHTRFTASPLQQRCASCCHVCAGPAAELQAGQRREEGSSVPHLYRTCMKYVGLVVHAVHSARAVVYLMGM